LFDLAFSDNLVAGGFPLGVDGLLLYAGADLVELLDVGALFGFEKPVDGLDEPPLYFGVGAGDGFDEPPLYFDALDGGVGAGLEPPPYFELEDGGVGAGLEPPPYFELELGGLGDGFEPPPYLLCPSTTLPSANTAQRIQIPNLHCMKPLLRLEISQRLVH